MADRICITGMGIVSALGENKYETEDKLLKEKSGIGKLVYLNSIHKEIPVGMVKIPDQKLKSKVGIDQNTIIARTTLLGILAAREAIIQAKLLGAGYKKIGFISGTTVGGMEKSEQFYLDFLHNDKHNEYISLHDCGACTEDIAKHLGNFDFCISFSACSKAFSSDCASLSYFLIFGLFSISILQTSIGIVTYTGLFSFINTDKILSISFFALFSSKYAVVSTTFEAARSYA